MARTTNYSGVACACVPLLGMSVCSLVRFSSVLFLFLFLGERMNCLIGLSLNATPREGEDILSSIGRMVLR